MFFKEKSRVNDVGSLKLARSEINVLEGGYTKQKSITLTSIEQNKFEEFNESLK